MRVSIIILSYNYEAFVESTIRSALAQDHPDLEIIVVDDGSTDGSRAIIERYEDRLVTIFKENGGQPSAYNVGFARATGDVVIFLDADDTLDPDACQQIVRAFETASPGAGSTARSTTARCGASSHTGVRSGRSSRPAAPRTAAPTPGDAVETPLPGGREVVKVHYTLRLVDTAGRPLGGVLPSKLGEGDVGALLRTRGQLYQSAPGSGNAYRKSALDRLMPMPVDATDPHGADFFVVYGITLLGDVRVAGDGPLGTYRVHRGAFTSQLTFGNTAAHFAEPYASYRRYGRLRAWVSERLGDAHALPLEVCDFSLEKQGYATTLFASDESYLSTLQRGARYLTERVLPAIWARPGSNLSRVALTGWAVSVLVLPRPIGSPLARYVCNPASR